MQVALYAWLLKHFIAVRLESMDINFEKHGK